MDLKKRALAQLLDALSLVPSYRSRQDLISAFWSDGEFAATLVQTADERMLLSALVDRLLAAGVLLEASNIDPLSRQLLSARQNFKTRRTLLTGALREIIGAFDAASIDLTILKGSTSLVTREPEWRFQRDLDLLISKKDRKRATEVLKHIGFRPDPNQVEVEHHLQPMIRDDLPASVELHHQLSQKRAERVFSTADFLANRRTVEFDGVKTNLPGPVEHLLHIVIHSYFQHRNASYGVIALKQVYEFAFHLQSLSPGDATKLLVRGRMHPRLHAALDLWVAAAVDAFDADLPAPVTVRPDALRRWHKLKSRLTAHTVCWPWIAYLEEVRMTDRRREFGGLTMAYLHPLIDILRSPIRLNYQAQFRDSAGLTTK